MPKRKKEETVVAEETAGEAEATKEGEAAKSPKVAGEVTRAYETRSRGKKATTTPPPTTPVSPRRATPKKKKQKEEEAPATKEGKQSEVIHAHEKDAAHKSEILEKGYIYFFYRPKVAAEEVHEFKDVQRLYVVLWPQAHLMHKGEHPVADKGVKRVIVIPKKKLPDIGARERYWAVMEFASENMDELDKDLGEKHYATHTRGERVLHGARPAGEGVYAIVEHKGHTHLAYALEIPHDIGEVQESFNIEKEGSFVIAVKNPHGAAATYFKSFVPEEKRVHYPKHLQDVFHGKRWAPAKPVELLNYPKSELLLVGSSENLVEEFGEVGEALEEMEKLDEKRLTDKTLFEELHMTKKEHPPQPLLKGEWK